MVGCELQNIAQGLERARKVSILQLGLGVSQPTRKICFAGFGVFSHRAKYLILFSAAQPRKKPSQAVSTNATSAIGGCGVTLTSAESLSVGHRRGPGAELLDEYRGGPGTLQAMETAITHACHAESPFRIQSEAALFAR
jgi:heterodisulfide reductase subunit B